MPDLGLVVPFYNEEGTAGPITQELLAALQGSGLSFELVLVTDGSTDGTAAEIEAVCGDRPNVRVLRGPTADGYGAAILRGLNTLSADIVGWTDGDGQVPPRAVLDLHAAMRRSGASVGVAERNHRRDGAVRTIASRGYNALMRSMLGVRFDDINAKPKLLERRLVRELGLSAPDWFIDTELVVGGLLRGEPIVRTPAPFLPRERGASKVSGSIIGQYWRNLRRLRRKIRLSGVQGGRPAPIFRAEPAEPDERPDRPHD